MAHGTRSPLGELLFRHRRRLGMSQGQLANRISVLYGSGAVPAPVSERTIAGIERRTMNPAQWRSPRLPTVHALAHGLHLKPSAPEHDAFLEAALEVQQRSAAAAVSPGFLPAGREQHLDRLRQVMDTAAAGTCGVTLVKADAGTGKTWLIEHACREAGLRHPDMVVLWAQCPEPDDTTDVPEPYEPLRQHLRLMLGELDLVSPRQLLSDTNRVALVKRVPAAVSAMATEAPALLFRFAADLDLWRYGDNTENDSDVRTRVEAVLRQPASSHRHAGSLAEQLARLVIRYAMTGPVVLVVDDLHWTDGETVSALTHLAQRLHGQRLPVLLIGTCRPGHDEHVTDGTSPPLGRLLHRLERLYPHPVLDLSTAVGGEAGRAFVEAVLEQEHLAHDREIAELLFERTAGLPLFVTSFLRLHRTDGELDVEALRQELIDPSVPVAVQSVFAEQLQRLRPEVRTLLEAASVQGERFLAEPIMEMLGLSRERFIHLVDSRLVRQFRLVWSGGTITIAGRPAHRYEFSHVLLRDYLLGGLTELERAHYHARMAEALITLYGTERHDATDLIAWHFDHAGDPTRAATAHLRAGVHWLILGQHERANRHFERTLELDVRTTDPETHVSALLGLGNSARAAGQPRRARMVLERALRMAEAEQLPVLTGLALEALVILDFDAGDMQTGADRFESVVERFGELGDREETARALTHLAHMLHGLGRYEAAETHARRAAEMADHLGNDRIWAEAWNTVGICRMNLGRLEEALEIHRHCIEVCAAIGDTHRERLGWLNVSQALFELERWEDAWDAVKHVLEDRETTSSRLVASGSFNAGVIAEGMGTLDEARQHYDTARRLREVHGQGATLIDALAGLLRVAVAAGDLKARELRDDIARRIESRGGVDGIEHPARLYLTLINASGALGDLKVADRYRREAVAFLTDRANSISDPSLRQSYLHNLPADRSILTLLES